MIRILVAADGSEPVTRASQALGALLPANEGHIRVLTVLSFELDPYTLLGEELADTPERVRLASEAVEKAVVGPRNALTPVAGKIEVRHRFGNPADEILSEIEEWKPDLVVLGRRGLSGPTRWLLGSVSERVIRHAHVPVLVAS